MSKLVLDVGLATKLKVAFARNGWTEQLIDVACKGDALGEFRRVLLGEATIVHKEYVIDCDAFPFVPDGYAVESHFKGGAYTWVKEAQAEALYLSDQQEGRIGTDSNSSIPGHYLYGELVSRNIPVLNANVLMFLLKYPQIIPEEWRNRRVHFWGTVYRNKNNHRYVLCLYCTNNVWQWGYTCTMVSVFRNDPAAIRAPGA